MYTPQRICVPTDFSTLAEKALAFAVDIARNTGAQLHLIHVLRSADDVAEMHLHPDLMRDSPEVTRFLASLEATDSVRDAAIVAEAVAEVEDPFADLDIVRASRVGVPVEEIVTYIRSHDIDLVVMASHGRTNWEQLFAGSVTSGVIQAAPCPVLVIPRGAVTPLRPAVNETLPG